MKNMILFIVLSLISTLGFASSVKPIPFNGCGKYGVLYDTSKLTCVHRVKGLMMGSTCYQNNDCKNQCKYSVVVYLSCDQAKLRSGLR